MSNPQHMTPDQIAAIEEDCVRILQEMIRIPSVNFGEGKGNEKAVAEYVAAQLSDVGIASEFIVAGENRVSVVARISGSDTKRPG